MDLSGFINSIVSFAQNNPVIAIAVALVLLFFMYRNTKLFFNILFFGLFLASLYYLITDMAGSSVEKKKKLIPEEEQQFDNKR